MIKTAKDLFWLQKTYRTNSMLYYLKRLPLLGRVFPYSLYGTSVLKQVFTVLSVPVEIGKIFVFKALYLFILSMVVGNLSQVEGVILSETDILLNLLLFCTLAGGAANCFVLEPKKDQSYAILYMRMEAKQVALTGLFQFLFSSVLGFLPFFLLFPSLRALGFLNILALFVILLAAKLLGGAVKLHLRTKNKNTKLMHESFKELFISALIAGAGVLLILLNIRVQPVAMLVIAVALALLGVPAVRYLLHFSGYLRLYKDMYAQYENALQTKGNSQTAKRTMAANYIENEGEVFSNKKGYALLSDCFMKRHKKLLVRFSKRVVFFELAALLFVVLACFLFSEVAQMVNENVVNVLPLFTYLLYFLNCGERTVKILFMNCDSEMLCYRFYRLPKAVLEMFTLRLKALVPMDWLQSLPLALALPLVLFVSGGTENPGEYLILFISIMALSTFFSVHNLVIYYLFQPYNKEVEMKNPIYTIIKTVTYVACFVLMQTNPPFAVFGVAVSVFCLVYLLVSLPLAYRIAPKTFKLK